MRVAVIGATGQLGRDCCEALARHGQEVIALGHEAIEVRRLESVAAALHRAAPDWVLLTAALHDVPACERRPLDAFAVNALGAKHVAQVSAELGASVLYVSTDYVFDGRKGRPYEETDAPGPLNVYGLTKLCGEHLVRQANPRHAIVRTSGLYGRYPCRGKGANFVERMLQLARERGCVQVVDDELLSPTYTADLAEQIAVLCERGAFGVFHATAQGACSWYDFAEEIFARTGVPVQLERARPGQFAGEVRRPKYSVLDNVALRRLGLDRMRPWREALHDYLALRAAA